MTPRPDISFHACGLCGGLVRPAPAGIAPTRFVCTGCGLFILPNIVTPDPAKASVDDVLSCEAA